MKRIKLILAVLVLIAASTVPSSAEDIYLGGFLQGLYGGGLHDDNPTSSEMTASETRLQLKLESFSDLCSAIESEAQRDMEVSRLRTRRIMPDTLRARCADLSLDLVAQISRTEDGGAMLNLLDTELLEKPSVLSVLALTRMTRVQSAPASTPSETLSRSSTRFSESLRHVRGLAVVAEYKPLS